MITDGTGNLGFVDQTGGSGGGSPGVTTTSSTGQVGIDSVAKATYSAAIYKVQVTSGSLFILQMSILFTMEHLLM